MKAIEINSKTDKFGYIKIDYKLDQFDKDVRILIFVDDDDDEEKTWLKSISNNPEFDFLNDPEEDIYSLNDGKPLND